MSYQVLARKWRPRSFPEMAGQEHVLRALIHALDEDRLHHAFLFTGTRGVGKTTVARILAKSLNCEKGVSSTPCGECAACREIDEGRFVDLIEVDAASRTKVEDTRELLDNVQYAPTRGRYKVYLIDEVHMLSNHSFNALLKTLEEPPPHVKFLLATTDPQKLPVTILSRCLQFSLKRLPLELIRDHLAHILGQEGIEAEPAALQELARAADGSMRDALSLLDQAIAFGGGAVRQVEVRDMLGTIDRDRVLALLQALAAADGERLLAESAALAELSPDYMGVLNELATLLHRVAIAQTVPTALDESYGDAEAVRTLADTLSPEDVQLYYQVAVTGRRDLPLAPDARSGFDMVLLRMLAFRPATPGAPGAGSGGGSAGPAADSGGGPATPSGSTPVSAAGHTDTTSSGSAGVAAIDATATQGGEKVKTNMGSDEAAGQSARQQGMAAVRAQLLGAESGSKRSAASQPSRTQQPANDDVGVSGEVQTADAKRAGQVETSQRVAKPVVAAAPASDEPPAQELPPLEGYAADSARHEEAGEGESYLSDGLDVDDNAERPEAEQSSPVSPAQPGVLLESQVDEQALALRISEQADAWGSLVEALPIAGMVRHLAMNCALLGREGGRFELAIDPQVGRLVNEARIEELRLALSEHLGEPARLQTVEASSDEATPEQRRLKRQAQRQLQVEGEVVADPLVRALVERFEASIIAGSTRPLH